MQRAYVAAERVDLIRIAIPEVSIAPAIALPLGFTETVASEEEAVKKIVQGWLEVSGPVTRQRRSTHGSDLARQRVDAATSRLGERRGGDARPIHRRISRPPKCRRRRMVRPGLAGAHSSIDPGQDAQRNRTGIGRRLHQVSAHLAACRCPVPDCAAATVCCVSSNSCKGLELPAPAWEQHVLPARIENYDPADLEHLCLSGIVAWGRLRNDTMPRRCRGGPKTSPGKRMKRLLAPARNAPIAFLLREELANYLEAATRAIQEYPKSVGDGAGSGALS